MNIPNPQDYAIREILAMVASIVFVIWSRFYAEFFSIVGIHSPIRTKEAYRKMGRRLLQSMGKMDSSRVVLFRTSNGESYVLGNPSRDTKISVTYNFTVDGFAKIPDYEVKDRAFQVLLLVEQSAGADKIYYTNELKYDFLKSFLFEYDIQAFCIVKVLDETKRRLYGFCIYTWSDVKTVPNKPGMDSLKDKEYINFLSIYIKEKYIEIIQYSFMEKLKRGLKLRRFNRLNFLI